MRMHWPLTDSFDRLLSDLVPQVAGAPAVIAEHVVPRADVVDTPEAYQLIVEMPGVTREALSIQLENDTLELRGTRTAPPADRVLVNGRGSDRPFVRRFAIGNDIDRNGIQARLENGLLTVTLPRREEVKPRRIEVQVES